mmetsp:Transcript_857/g.3119  ORF Transcript_857/g.3119 Transcript_857/m.3119 type:complete len:656 (+) Transcript_857:87-2054(+)
MAPVSFKNIAVVPTAKSFMDIVLSKTQRQTPTVCHNGWNIQRIRSFYMRKVKYTQSTWHERLTRILDDFPRVEDIHPFYADLLNVLYDKDHYKLALGQLATARTLIERLAKEYVRLLKYGDSLYRCKTLKRAALGRMCTLMKKHGPSLAYLEQVRQHMGRLPSIDPNTRTLLVCGYPNVGKSSFVNKLTRADVEVQPYAFTTKSLYVGHMDYKYVRWQVIDTPGILDKPLEERNTIEMQAITALAHIRAAVLYFVDLSEQCGYSIEQQSNLFHSITPLFANKPLILVCNKSDSRKLEDLDEKERQLVEEMEEVALKSCQIKALTMSTLTEEGVMDVKTKACDQLLGFRVEAKLKGNKVDSILNRVHVARPKPRDNVSRPPVIPPQVLAKRQAGQVEVNASSTDRKTTEKELMEQNGGAGVYSMDWRKNYLLENDEWKYDVMPEIVDGHNVADFIDKDILAKLEELEREEEQLEAEYEREKSMRMEEEDPLSPEQRKDLTKIRMKKKLVIANSRLAKSVKNNRSFIPRTKDKDRSSTVQRMEEQLAELGYDPSLAVERARSVSRGRKRTRSEAPDAMEEDDRSRSPSRSRSRALSTPRDVGLKDEAQRAKVTKIARKAQKPMNKKARIGEADRTIPTKMPKHLFSGKRGNGKTDRR